ncbi:HAD family hydrolase [Mycetocola spongiae]|uniref:HAD family hydrolase n=1 Tax=Mycetocola spongiae TaxID=2859226 RepID=UPI001CF5EAB2|nr:HAD family phosphatase [Mycetocola spongiae]
MSSLSLHPRTVVFDYGDVISREQIPAEAEHTRALTGIPAAEFWPAYWRHREALDCGTLSIEEYWQKIARESGREFDRALIQEIWISDYRSWLSINPEVFRIIEDLTAGGTRLALLSNAGADFGGYFRFGPLADHFDEFIVSGEIGLVKPHADIYEYTLAALGITAERMVFIDNRPENIEAARSLGITGHVFTGAEGLRAFLSDLASATH